MSLTNPRSREHVGASEAAGSGSDVYDEILYPTPAYAETHPDRLARMAILLGLEPPPLVPLAEAELSPMARSFYADNKRVSNALIRNELGVRLDYPDYRAGLAAILAAGG